jgi:ketosteroid isomerase-like protein
LRAPIRLPVDINQLNDPRAKTRAEIELRRLKGHLTTCLRREPQDIGVALGELSHKIEHADSVIAVVVKCQYDTSKDGKQYRKEYLQKALST